MVVLEAGMEPCTAQAGLELEVPLSESPGAAITHVHCLAPNPVF